MSQYHKWNAPEIAVSTETKRTTFGSGLWQPSAAITPYSGLSNFKFRSKKQYSGRHEEEINCCYALEVSVTNCPSRTTLILNTNRIYQISNNHLNIKTNRKIYQVGLLFNVEVYLTKTNNYSYVKQVHMCYLPLIILYSDIAIIPPFHLLNNIII